MTVESVSPPRAHPRRRELPVHPWIAALWLVLVLRLCFEVVGLLSLQLQPITVVGGDWLNLLIPGNDVPHEALSLWQRWDALWYQQIALHGYAPGNGTGSFYPLFPLLSRIVSLGFDSAVVPAELIVTSAALAVALPLLYDLARLDMEPDAAGLSVLLLLSFPVAFFLLAPMTEALFLASTVASFWLARTGRPWMAGLVGFVAGLTRMQGAILTLPLCYLVLQRRAETGRGRWWDVLSGALPGLGGIVITLYLRRVVGEWETGLTGQQRWGYQLVLPWHAIGASWQHIVRTGDPIEVLNLSSLLLFTVLAVWLTRRLPLSYALYVWPYLALLYTRQMYVSPLMSVSRFMLVLFPCFLVAAPVLSRRLPLAAALVLLGIAVQVTLFTAWVHFTFVA